MSHQRVQLRHALASDLDDILALERACARAPHWPPAAYSAILNAWDVAPSNPAGPRSSPQRCLIVAHVEAHNAGRILAETGCGLAGFAVGLMQSVPASRDSYPLHATYCADHVAELESIVVAASERRGGIGRALSIAVLDWCRSQGATEVVLEVRATSAAAIALYAGLGFANAGRRPRYYSDPEEDAILMRLHWA